MRMYFYDINYNNNFSQFKIVISWNINENELQNLNSSREYSNLLYSQEMYLCLLIWLVLIFK